MPILDLAVDWLLYQLLLPRTGDRPWGIVKDRSFEAIDGQENVRTTTDRDRFDLALLCWR